MFLNFKWLVDKWILITSIIMSVSVMTGIISFAIVQYINQLTLKTFTKTFLSIRSKVGFEFYIFQIIYLLIMPTLIFFGFSVFRSDGWS